MKRFFLFILFWPGFALSVPFEGTQFVISGPSPHSVFVAEAIFKQGGNLADIAVSSALALAVTHPYYVSLGSGGFALVKMNSTIEALDFREAAPRKMSSDFFKKSGLSSQTGGAAVGVPGFVAGLVELHRKHGRLSWKKLVQPAIFLAEKGFPVSGKWVSITQQSKNKFNAVGKSIFLKKAYTPNELFKQPQLAKALKLLQYKKSKAFYSGPIGKDIIFAVRKKGGVMEEEDLEEYKTRWLKPVSVSFRGYRIYSMPLPSSGGIILSRSLKLIERQKLYREELYSVNELHLLAEIMARAFYPEASWGIFKTIVLKKKRKNGSPIQT